MARSPGAREADDDGLNETIVALTPIVRAVCFSRLRGRPAPDIEDAVQETLLGFVQSDRAGVANLEAWITSIAVHVCNHALRSYYVRASHETAQAHYADHADDPSETAVTAVELQDLAQRLPERDRQLLAWLYGDRLTHDEIASRLHTTVGNARILALRARRRARQAADSMGIDL
jgi:RNA polymerase sigma-70 factor (ECF subfamily)